MARDISDTEKSEIFYSFYLVKYLQYWKKFQTKTTQLRRVYVLPCIDLFFDEPLLRKSIECYFRFMCSSVTCIEQIWTTINTVKLSGSTPVSGIRLTYGSLCNFNLKNASIINVLPLTITFRYGSNNYKDEMR